MANPMFLSFKKYKIHRDAYCTTGDAKEFIHLLEPIGNVKLLPPMVQTIQIRILNCDDRHELFDNAPKKKHINI